MSFLRICFFLCLGLTMSAQPNPYLQADDAGQLRLTEAGASHFAKLALGCMQKEYPNKLNQVLPDASMIQSPKELHPAFYGCLDWHSAVHGHWMLIRLLKEFPNMPEAELIRQKLNENLTTANIQAEVAYLEQASKSWERMYGWAWLLKLTEEAHLWKDSDSQKWAKNLAPLAAIVIKKYQEFLPIQKYPVRTGVHPNTAFGLSYAWDYAHALNQIDFKTQIETTAKRYYLNDKNYPIEWEPSGEDFLSAGLEEAGLMSRVLPAEAYAKWFKAFLPKKKLAYLDIPADVSDRSDPKIVHLDGLNLSRAWSMYQIIHRIDNKKIKTRLTDAAQKHLMATIPNIATEHYEGSHWLASFAVYALSTN